MKMGFLRLWDVIPISVLLEQVVHADVAPPPETVAALALGVVGALGLLVAAIVIVSVLVIRAIKKKNASKKDDS